jgi:anti-anti-sigma factor
METATKKLRRLSVSETSHSKEIQILVESFSGPLFESASNPPKIQAVFQPIIEGRTAKRMICDLTGVDFLGADELGALVWAFAECQKQMLQIRYVVPQGRILDKLLMSRLDTLLRIFDTVEDALESF